jgi:hypothetical protein
MRRPRRTRFAEGVADRARTARRNGNPSVALLKTN